MPNAKCDQIFAETKNKILRCTKIQIKIHFAIPKMKYAFKRH